MGRWTTVLPGGASARSHARSDPAPAPLPSHVNEINKITINLALHSEITIEHIEQYVGISKDFNIFELQKALGKKDILKVNQIINHFASNPKDNPLVKTISILYTYFLKTIMYHELKDKSKNNVASRLSINPFFINDFQIAAKNYSATNITSIISLLQEYDMRSKGVNNSSTSEGELLKELAFKILHL